MIPAPRIVLLERDEHQLRPGERQKWNVTLHDEVLVTRSRDPEHDACRALLARGITGKATFVHRKSGTAGLTMDVEKGSRLTVTDEDRGGLRLRKYRPPSPDIASPDFARYHQQVRYAGNAPSARSSAGT